ncbi:MAG: hypothetical protein AB8B61_05920 [Cyclobacteriaceae bacterium]
MQDYLQKIAPEEMTKLLDELMYCLVFVADKENIYEGQLFSMYENIRELRNEFGKLSAPEPCDGSK